MRILLLSRNRVVQELVRLGLHPIKGVELEILDRPEPPASDRYDLILEEDRFVEEIREIGIVLQSEPDDKTCHERESIRDFLEEERLRFDEETEILDEEEIRRIRRLLEGEIEEPSSEMTFNPSEQTLDVETFLELIERFRSKKLKKLLRGATIRISIEFPEEER